MHISRIVIKNFRNFSNVDVELGKNAVIVGENGIGKSNFIHALRLILDPSLPEYSRQLRQEDFWDGLERPLGKEDRIEISIDIAEFEDIPEQLALLADHLIQPEPMVARLTYIWQPLPGLENEPKKDADYEYLIFGGGRPENRINYEVRRRLPFELMQALRDVESDLARWTRSPLRPLLDKAATAIEAEKLETIASKIDSATDEIAKVPEIERITNSITERLEEMVGEAQSIDTKLGFAPTSTDRLIRTLRLFIDGGKRGISDASLGSSNLLYLALKSIEYKYLHDDGSREHTFLAIEEPEAHLHPNLQRLVFRDYLRSRNEPPDGEEQSAFTILLTTHSPHIASVTPIRDIVLLKRAFENNSTIAKSTAPLKLSKRDIQDLERYMDATRGEVLFAKAVMLVEGDAEVFLLPALARNQDICLDEYGISVCSISGTNFAPYLKLLGPHGLDIPFSALTDYDPVNDNDDDDTDEEALGPSRVINQMMSAILSDEEWDKMDGDEILNNANAQGIFINTHTLEVDLWNAGLEKEFATAMKQIQGKDQAYSKRMHAWESGAEEFDEFQFLKDISAVGKGRFAQRLATVIMETQSKSIPDYIDAAFKYLLGRVNGD